LRAFEIPLKRWFGDASHRCPALPHEAVEAENTIMNCPRPIVCLAPIPASPSLRNPRILLVGQHQPNLLRSLDGWPRRRGKPGAFVARFIDQHSALKGLPDNSFELAVIQAPSAQDAHEVIAHAVRIARQGLITLR